ncbi:MAG: AmmeMemoRadiSam system protein A [Candidatus Thorarchaeota archaeon]
MDHAYSDKEGTLLVKLARQTVDEFVLKNSKPDPPDDAPPKLWEKSGVFVTLNLLEGSHVRLRGCIGRPYPTQPLIEATIDSAVDAAVNDYRFGPLSPEELDQVIVDLSVLTPPRKLEYSSPEDLMNIIEVGRDGLIASRGMMRGLLLPQVPVQYGWNVKTFLEHTCNKAGLPADLWKTPDVEFMSFQAEIFGETAPRENIVRNPEHSKC